MSPFALPRWTITIALYGFGLYVRLFGQKRALKLVGAGLAGSTVLAVVLNYVT